MKDEFTHARKLLEKKKPLIYTVDDHQLYVKALMEKSKPKKKCCSECGKEV